MNLIDSLFEKKQTLGEVRKTPELTRIELMPEREPDALAKQIYKPLSRMLKLDEGEQVLRPLQALALAEIVDFGGAMILLGVGEGKTLVTYLAPILVKSKRPLLLMPANLKKAKLQDFSELSKHWLSHDNYTILSYEYVSRNPQAISDLEPDIIIADEGHCLKDQKAACTKRVGRYLRDNPETAFVCLSGTLTNRSFLDWWHLQRWALPKELNPLPNDWQQVQAWCEALDQHKDFRRDLGALEFMGSNLEEVRKEFGRKLRNTPGVIVSETTGVTASLSIELEELDLSEIRENISSLEATWALPNGTEFIEATDLWRHKREMCQGFYYDFEEKPPEEWLEARYEANKFVRNKLKYSRTLDTPGQVVEAYKYQDVLKKWFEIKDSFKLKTKANWLTSSVLRAAESWADRNDSIVWIEHRAVGEEIEHRGLPYFVENGYSKKGLFIEDYKGPCVASIKACGKGFNIQQFDRALVLSSPRRGDVWEQLLGRLHRQGQEYDHVRYEVLVTHETQRNDFLKACKDAYYIQNITRQKQKLCYADVAL